MQRYFIEKITNEKSFFLNEKDSYHIQKVMRMKVGEKIEVVSEEKVYECKIRKLGNEVEVEVVAEKTEENHLNYSVVLVQSLVKEQKMDYILQKGTELGMTGIYPYQAERSIVKVEKKETKKIERWKNIVKEASEQSKQNKIPFVGEVLTLEKLVELKDFDYKFLATTNEKEKNLKKVLSKVKKSATMIIVIGPEGGFSKEEEQKLMENGYIPVSLGKSILRTETAGLFFMSVIRYIDME